MGSQHVIAQPPFGFIVYFAVYFVVDISSFREITHPPGGTEFLNSRTFIAGIKLRIPGGNGFEASAVRGVHSVVTK